MGAREGGRLKDGEAVSYYEQDSEDVRYYEQDGKAVCYYKRGQEIGKP